MPTMFDINGLVFYARYLGRKTLSKGHSRGLGIGLAVGPWLGFELLFAVPGVFLAVEMDAGTMLVLLIALLGAGVGVQGYLPAILSLRT